MPQFIGPGPGSGTFGPGRGVIQGPGFVHGFGPGQPWWIGWLGWFLPMVVLAAATGLVVWTVLRVTRRAPAPALAGAWVPAPRFGPDPAMEHARVRYARGELSREDYLRVTEDLAPDRANAAPPPAPPAGPEPEPEPEPDDPAA